MKKIILASALAAFSGLIFFESFAASNQQSPAQSSLIKTIMDTVPGKKKDSTWNKKKYPDTTQLPKRDTAGRH